MPFDMPETSDLPHNTNTVILADGGFVIAKHDKLVGTQFLSPDVAEQMASALLEAAKVARRQRQQRVQ